MASFIVCMFNHVLFFNLVDGMEVLEREGNIFMVRMRES